MNRSSRMTLAALGFAVLFIFMGPAWSAIDLHTAQEWRFRVLLDDKDIGYHTFSVVNQDGQEVVESHAEFDVRVLFLRVYSYRHENVEVWQDGCLTRITAQTDDNGEQYTVNGERKDKAFNVVTQVASQTLAQECIMTFAYWKRDFLDQSRLLNSQTGEYQEVEVQPLGENTFQLPSGNVRADGFQILARGEKLDIKVWYAKDSQRWLALESAVDNGRTLRYLPT